MNKKLEAGKGCPVMHGFDHESPEHAANWPNILRSMREQCPRAWSESYGGHWVATRYEDVVKIAQTDNIFGAAKKWDSEKGEYVGGTAVSSTGAPPMIPLESDNPEWYGYRSLLNKHFAPKIAEEKREFAKGVARTLVNRVIEKGQFDIVHDLANPLPAIFTMNLLGMDLSSWNDFADPLHRFAYMPASDPEFPSIVAEFVRLGELLRDAAIERRGNPRDDLLSHMANGDVGGRKMTDEELLNMAMLVVIGGVDTTTALTANTLRYLGLHPEHRQKLIDDPSKIPVAREEFVRYFTPVHATARHVKQEFEMDGWHFEKGEKILMGWASANRDAEIFDDPETIHLDRFPNRHIGFGAGNHRCIGSFFARVMFESMLQEVLERMPDYEVVEEDAHCYTSVGKTNGWITIPAIFRPGPKLPGGIDF